MPEPSGKPASLPQLTPGQIISGTLVLMAVAFGFWLLYQYWTVVIVLFAAIVISTAIKPIADRIARLRLPRPANVALAYALLILPLLAALFLATPMLTNQAARISSELPAAYIAIREDMLEHPNFVVWRVARVLPEELELEAPANQQTEPVGEDEISAAAALLNTLGSVGRSLFALVAVLVLSYYWTLDGQRIQQSLLLALPREKRAKAQALALGMQQRLAAFVLGQGLLSLMVGGLAFIAYLLIGLPNALLLAVFAAIGEAIPLVGPSLGAIPAALVGYSIAPVNALWVLVATLVIQQVEANVLIPRVMRRTAGVHPILSIMALTAFSLLFGVAGALVAIPFAAVSQYLITQLVDERSVTDVPPGRDYMNRLRYEAHELAQDVRKQIRHRQEDLSETELLVSDRLERLASDLDRLLAEREETEESSS